MDLALNGLPLGAKIHPVLFNLGDDLVDIPVPTFDSNDEWFD